MLGTIPWNLLADDKKVHPVNKSEKFHPSRLASEIPFRFDEPSHLLVLKSMDPIRSVVHPLLEYWIDSIFGNSRRRRIRKGIG